MKCERKNIWHRIWHWYIKGEYHCDKCPYSWEEQTSYEDNEWDAGCFIKGDICDTCRLLPPFRWVVGTLRKKKAEYYRNHQYDGMGEWYEAEEAKREKLVELVNRHIVSGCELCWKNEGGEYIPINTSATIRQASWRVCTEFERFLEKQESNRTPQRNPWVKALLWSWQGFAKFFKPYFCK